MSQPLVRRSETWKFSHAAAAMGAFWARARRIEARRIARAPQRRCAGSKSAAESVIAAAAARQP